MKYVGTVFQNFQRLCVDSLGSVLFKAAFEASIPRTAVGPESAHGRKALRCTLAYMLVAAINSHPLEVTPLGRLCSEIDRKRMGSFYNVPVI